MMARLAHFLLEPFFRLAFGPPLPDRVADPSPYGNEGVVLIVQGVGGLDLCAISLRHVLAAEKLPYEVFVFHWGHGFGRWFADLTRVPNRDRQIERLAEWIRNYRRSHPGKRVEIVAKSAGSGVVVKALELLEPETVTRVVLLAPAIWPKYDLTRALRASVNGITVFWSPLDVIILGAGTRLFGTIDRVHSVGAGLVGFEVPESGDSDSERARQYRKLTQVRWSPRMMRLGNFGGHIGPDSPVFLKKFVVPLLRTAPPGVC